MVNCSHERGRGHNYQSGVPAMNQGNATALSPETYSQHEDLQWFIANQDQLVKQCNGKTLIIRNQAVVGVLDVELDAYLDARRRFAPGTFSIQECIAGEEAYTSYIYSIEEPYHE
jgi:hypothetical protein